MLSLHRYSAQSSTEADHTTQAWFLPGFFLLSTINTRSILRGQDCHRYDKLPDHW
jgi:hypothetical protein